MTTWLDEVKFNEQGLIPAIAQDYQTGRVLMVAWQNRESLALTVQKKQAVYYSRSRQKLWHKGEESGHFQKVHEVRLDCDSDVIILQVEQYGHIACHTGRESCFYRKLTEQGWEIVEQPLKDPQEIYHSFTHKSEIDKTEPTISTTETLDILDYLAKLMIQRKSANANESYIANLYHKGLNKILEKVGEENIETIIAAKNYQYDRSEANKNDLIYEIADLWFHSIIMLGYFDLNPQIVLDELTRRQGLSGLVEKANRHNDD